MDVHLSVEETNALRKAMQIYLSDLRTEIAHTDDREFKEGLREERAALESSLDKLDEAARQGERDADGRTVVRFVAIWST